MKKTQFIELLKNIKKTAVSFVAITMFVALAVGLFGGISSASDALMVNLSDEMEKGNAFDLHLTYPYGFTDEDLTAIGQIDGVDDVEGSYTVSALLAQEDSKAQIEIKSISSRINTLYDVEGELPDAKGEIAVEAEGAATLGIGIGDTLVFEADQSDTTRSLVAILHFDPETDDITELMDYVGIGMTDTETEQTETEQTETENRYGGLTTDTFTVTALVHSPEYISRTAVTYGVSQTTLQDVDCLMFADLTSFDTDAFPGYNNVYIRSDSLRGLNAFRDTYSERADRLQETVEEGLEPILDARYAFVMSQANEVLAAADAKLEDFKSRIDSAANQLEDAELELEDARDQLVVAEAETGTLDILMNGAEQETAKLDQNYSKIKNQYQYTGQNKVLGYLSYQAFSASDKKVSTLEGKIAALRTNLTQAQASVASGKAAYAEARQQLSEGKEELADARESYDQAVQQYEEYEEKLTALQQYDCTFVQKQQNPAAMMGESLSELLLNLRYSMTLLFLIVGILVCFSSVSRIIHDQMVAIGTKKALGLNQGEITAYYLLYTGLAAAVGVAIGLAISMVVQVVLLSVFAQNFVMESMRSVMRLQPSVLAVCLAEFAVIAFVTYLACARILKQPAVSLLKGPSPAGGKKRLHEYLGFWSSLSLLTQTIINNCVNDKRRVAATLIGVAGCTSLIVTAFTMSDNIFDSIEVQFEDYYHFDSLIYFDESEESGDTDADETVLTSERIADILEEYDAPNALITSHKYLLTMPDGKITYTTVYVPDDLSTFVDLVSLKTEDEANYNDPYGGVWMTDAFSEYYGTEANTKISLLSTDGSSVMVNLDGFYCAHQQGNQIMMSKEKYEQYYGTEPQPNCFLLDTSSLSAEQIEELNQSLQEVDGYIRTKNYKQASVDTYSVFKSLSAVIVAVYLGLSVIMSLLVLLNLMDLCVAEKKKELIVLMINGFSIHDAKRYVYSDTVLIAAVGTTLGVFLGNFVGNLSVKACEAPNVRFLHGTDLKADLIGICGSFLLTFIVSAISLKKIEKFRLRDINEL